MRAPLLLLGAINVAASASDPGVFEDYFDDQIRSVDIPQESALKACLSNGDATGKKIQTAYDGCFGTDYDFNDLAENEEGKDSDGDDLPDEFEANEACFYSAMGWVSTDGSDVSLDTLEEDMAGLEEAVAKEFKANAKSCSKWSGDFGGGRRKREAGEGEVVPDLMASGRRSLGWVKSMARKTRSAEKGGKGDGKKTGKGKGKKGKGKGAGRQNKKVKGKKGNGAGRNNKKGNKKKGKGVGRNNKKGKGKKGKEAGKNKKGGKGKKVAGRNNKKGNGNKGKGFGRNNQKENGKKGKQAGRNKKGGKGNKGKGAGRKGDNAKKGMDGKGGEKKGTKKEGNKNRNGKGDEEKQMDEKIYNKLWCFDLAVEQALEKCVEDKIKN